MVDTGQPTHSRRPASLSGTPGAPTAPDARLNKAKTKRHLPSTPRLAAGIVSGGTGRRFGGLDKGWIQVGGRALVTHTIDRLSPQCDPIFINANRHLADYRQLGFDVYPDGEGADGGPLAGITALLKQAPGDAMLIVPVDTPLLPTDLGIRLLQGLTPAADLAFASTPAGPQRLHAVVRRRCLTSLAEAHAEGIKSVTDWQTALHCRHVAFDDNASFYNVNTPSDANAIAKRLGYNFSK